VVSGTLEVYKQIDDERVSLRMLGPGDMFGETAIFAASPRTANVVVLADASLVVVTSDVIEQELASMKPWMGAFIRTLASRFGGVEEERRARGHSGPSMSAVSPIPPGASTVGASVLAGASARPVTSAALVTSAVPRDRSDITIVADLMAESVQIDMSDVDDSSLSSTLVTGSEDSSVLPTADEDGATRVIAVPANKSPAPGS